MSLENALVVLVLIWTVIFIVFGVVMVVILVSLKKSIDRINRILSDAEDFTHGVSITGKAAAGALMGFINKNKKLLKR